MPELVPPVVPPGVLGKEPLPVLPVTDDLLLRPWTAADAPMLIDAFSDPATQYWHARTVESVAEAEALIASYADGWRKETSATWALADTTGEAFGRIALKTGHREQGEAEVAYWMRAAVRGRGAATSGVRAVSDWAFGTGFHRLTLVHSTENPASCRVAEKSGYALEGIMRSALLHSDGWHDCHLHARIAPD